MNQIGKIEKVRFVKDQPISSGKGNAVWKIWVISFKWDTLLAQWSSTRVSRAKNMADFGRSLKQFYAKSENFWNFPHFQKRSQTKPDQIRPEKWYFWIGQSVY